MASGKQLAMIPGNSENCVMKLTSEDSETHNSLLPSTNRAEADNESIVSESRSRDHSSSASSLDNFQHQPLADQQQLTLQPNYMEADHLYSTER